MTRQARPRRPYRTAERTSPGRRQGRDGGIRGTSPDRAERNAAGERPGVGRPDAATSNDARSDSRPSAAAPLIRGSIATGRTVLPATDVGHRRGGAPRGHPEGNQDRGGDAMTAWRRRQHPATAVDGPTLLDGEGHASENDGEARRSDVDRKAFHAPGPCGAREAYRIARAPAPGQPQSARREDDGEAPSPPSARVSRRRRSRRRTGDLAVMCPPHVDGHAAANNPTAGMMTCPIAVRRARASRKEERETATRCLRARPSISHGRFVRVKLSKRTRAD